MEIRLLLSHGGCHLIKGLFSEQFTMMEPLLTNHENADYFLPSSLVIVTKLFAGSLARVSYL
ncbi:hypothetical protein HKBW3C_02423 [Candidatus Hakubella thermalkaliphila]|nr:hypothetical protein HKBW3C_02423 [Candidatus Hakubella thermalkaliphila]